MSDCQSKLNPLIIVGIFLLRLYEPSHRPFSFLVVPVGKI